VYKFFKHVYEQPEHFKNIDIYAHKTQEITAEACGVHCRKISPSFVESYKHTLMASQPRYGEERGSDSA
jgi:hypothetical protein